MAKLFTTRLDLKSLLPEPMELLAAVTFLDKQEGFQPTEADQQIMAAHGMQLTGFFLIDRDGTIRWSFIEAPNRPGEFASSPSTDEILGAARALVH